MDRKELIGKVAAKHGIRLEPDDPAFALVTLNEAVLQEASAALTQAMERRLKIFIEAFARIERMIGKTLAQTSKDAIAELYQERLADIEKASIKVNELIGRVADSRSFALKWLAVGGFIGLLLFACGVVVGAKWVRR
jgi:hypothetical protein